MCGDDFNRANIVNKQIQFNVQIITEGLEKSFTAEWHFAQLLTIQIHQIKDKASKSKMPEKVTLVTWGGGGGYVSSNTFDYKME